MSTAPPNTPVVLGQGSPNGQVPAGPVPQPPPQPVYPLFPPELVHAFFGLPPPPPPPVFPPQPCLTPAMLPIPPLPHPTLAVLSSHLDTQERLGRIERMLLELTAIRSQRVKPPHALAIYRAHCRSRGLPVPKQTEQCYKELRQMNRLERRLIGIRTPDLQEELPEGVEGQAAGPSGTNSAN
ncbi:hypothetical protein AAVH_30497 [Aphelenchoides avenae]|nr:hypothetical protein AAVH_43105 [Aphelenchus avenae]KAH7702350.1 hypothetical protein AAVH_30497 [Aphelenchus avenae]